MTAPTDSSASEFDTLYAAEAGAVLQLCLGYARGDRSVAADLAQETWLAAWRGWAGFAGRAQPRTWLYRVAVNTCLGARRRAGSRPRVVTDEVPPLAAPADDGSATELYEAIGQLESVDRLVLMLHLEGFDYAEIATITGLSAGALRVRAHRARARLKTLLHHG